MLTDNFRLWQKFIMTNTGLSNTVKSLGGQMSSMSAAGTVTTGWTHMLANSVAFSTAYSALDRSHIFVGTGSTAPTAGDSGLTGVHALGTSVSATVTVSSALNNSTLNLTVQSVITNTTGNDITVNEIGWFKLLMLSKTAGATTAESCYVMMAREVLETPVVIAPDESKTFKLRLSV